jgi:hypothetical protein
MNIIERGELPNDHVMHGRCGNCKTLIECRRSEATALADRNEPPTPAITCPVCAGWIYLSEGKARKGKR